MSAGSSWEIVVVLLAVAGAGLWAARALVRSLKKPGGCSSCASGGSCPVAGKGSANEAVACGCPSDEPSPRRENIALH